MLCMSNIKFSLALTTFNRADQLISKIKKWELMECIDEIIVTDDCSNDYDRLTKETFSSKVKIFKNETNLGAYVNKIITLNKVKNNWSILIDSDNDFCVEYTNALFFEKDKNGLEEYIVYCPTKSKPNFFYPNLEDVVFDKNLWNEKHFEQGGFLNTCNFCISRKAIDVLNLNYAVDKTDPIAVDCKYMSYILLKNNFKLKGLKNLEYYHPISRDSFYIQNQYSSSSFDGSFNWKID